MEWIEHTAIRSGGGDLEKEKQDDVFDILDCIVLCNNAVVVQSKGTWQGNQGISISFVR